MICHDAVGYGGYGLGSDYGSEDKFDPQSGMLGDRDRESSSLPYSLGPADTQVASQDPADQEEAELGGENSFDLLAHEACCDFSLDHGLDHTALDNGLDLVGPSTGLQPAADQLSAGTIDPNPQQAPPAPPRLLRQSSAPACLPSMPLADHRQALSLLPPLPPAPTAWRAVAATSSQGAPPAVSSRRNNPSSSDSSSSDYIVVPLSLGRRTVDESSSSFVTRLLEHDGEDDAEPSSVYETTMGSAFGSISAIALAADASSVFESTTAAESSPRSPRWDVGNVGDLGGGLSGLSVTGGDLTISMGGPSGSGTNSGTNSGRETEVGVRQRQQQQDLDLALSGISGIMSAAQPPPAAADTDTTTYTTTDIENEVQTRAG